MLLKLFVHFFNIVVVREVRTDITKLTLNANISPTHATMSYRPKIISIIILLYIIHILSICGRIVWVRILVYING